MHDHSVDQRGRKIDKVVFGEAIHIVVYVDGVSFLGKAVALKQLCVHKCLTADYGIEGIQVCSICHFLWCQYSHHDQRRATNLNINQIIQFQKI